MIIKKAERIDVECIARGYITGSAWAEYNKSGTINGATMPIGLNDSQAFETPLFTPTTKAEEGHDMPMSYQELINMVGTDTAKKLETMTIKAYSWANKFANERGIILADTKFEFGWINGELSIIDEMLTPDSSRFWDLSIYKPGQPQPSFDKQYVRDWLSNAGWDKEPPAPVLPSEVVEKTSATYLEVFKKLTDLTLQT
jgi:phosphoribosylaminoimidazole-succinocarboxamide synthase